MSKNLKLWFFCGFFIFAPVRAPTANAGVLGGIGASWAMHSFSPLQNEDTPNYFSLGPYGAFGYSFGKVFDLNLFTRYHPARLVAPKPDSADASIVDYGAEINVRILKTIFIGISGGETQYQLFKQHDIEGEIPGKLSGPSGSFNIGAQLVATRHSFIQITFDAGAAKLNKIDGVLQESKARNLAWIGASISFVYIGLDSLRMDNILLKDWMGF